MLDKPKPIFRPLSQLSEHGLRLSNGFDTRGKHLQVQFEAPCQLNNAPAYFYNDIKIGMYSFIRYGIIRHVESIGRYCSIGPNVMIAEGEHPTNWLSTSPSQYTLPQFDFYPPEKEAAEKRRVKRTRKNSDGATGTTTVGHDVWIGGGASIRRGVKIGHGAIIAGNAFVTKDVAPYSVVAGTPAKHMRFRFNYATVRKLLTLRWWRFNINDLAGVPFDDITEALKQIQSMEKAGDISPAERKYKSVCVYTKGFYDLSETTETDPEAFPAPKDDPLGLPMYLDFVKSLTS